MNKHNDNDAVLHRLINDYAEETIYSDSLETLGSILKANPEVRNLAEGAREGRKALQCLPFVPAPSDMEERIFAAING